MTGLTDRFDDRLEPVGIATGVFVLVIVLGTLAGTPWSTNGSMLVSVIQLLGLAGMIAIGAGLVWLSRLE